jgi:hypothetical protein
VTLYDLAVEIRSKNAGPFMLTIDVLFGSTADMKRAMQAAEMSNTSIAQMYGVAKGDVRIHSVESLAAIKITLPRRDGAGSVRDTDVYGAQQHWPLAAIPVGDSKEPPLLPAD